MFKQVIGMSVNGIFDGLEKIVAATMADQVEAQLRAFLRNKPFLPGDALPTEEELARELGVSRNVLREALSRLRMLGLIESKKKRGMVLTRPDILRVFEKVLDPLVLDKETLQDIFELRLVLEMGLANLLFLRKTAVDVDELEAIARSEKHDSGKQFRLKAELDFHGKLYAMTGNNTLKRFQSMLLPLCGHVIAQGKKKTAGRVSHLDLVEILKTGTCEDFRKAMYEHLQPHFDRLAE